MKTAACRLLLMVIFYLAGNVVTNSQTPAHQHDSQNTPIYTEGEIQYILKNINQNRGLQLKIDRPSMEWFLQQGAVMQEAGLFDPAVLFYGVAQDLALKLNQAAEQAIALNNLGLLYKSAGRFREALPYLLRGASILEKLEDFMNLGTLQNNLGATYEELGYYDLAEIHYQKAIDIRVNNGFEKGLAITYTNIGTLQYRLGKYFASIDWNNRALALAEKLSLRKYQGIINSNAGLTYGAIRRFDTAFNHLKTAIRILEGEAEPGPLATAYNNLALVYGWQRNIALALNWYEKSRKILEKLNAPHLLARNYINIGTLHFQEKEYAAARSWFTKAIHIQEQLQLVPDLILSYNNLGVVARNENQYWEAQFYFQKAINLLQMNGFPVLRITGALWNNLGECYHQMGSYGLAQDNYHRALKAVDGLELDIEQSMICSNLANLFNDTARPDSALYFAERSIELAELLRAQNQGLESRQSFVTHSLSALDVAVVSAYQLGDFDLAFGYTEYEKARALSDLLVTPALIDKDLPPELARSYSETNARLAAALNNLSTATDSGTMSRLNQEKEVLLLQRQEVEAAIRQHSPAFAELAFPGTVTADQVREALGANEVLVSYYLTHKHIFAFVLTNEREEMIELGETPGLRKLIYEFRSSFVEAAPHAIGDLLKEKKLAQNFQQIAFQLHDILWRPLESTGLLGERDVQLISDGLVNYLPFELLISDNFLKPYHEYDYLITRHSFSYHPSATIFVRGQSGEKRPSPKQFDFFGLGIEEFKRTNENQEVPDLRYSIPEIEEISKTFGQSHKILTGLAASEFLVKREALKKYKYLHFSTHGVFDPVKPDFSRIILHPGQNEDGNLHVFEMYDLDIDAELVVLSACDSGRGQLQRGEGIRGFARALLHAGASSLILSTWQVEEESTKELFVSYYHALASDSRDKCNPLWQSKMDLMRAGGTYSNPYFWAPFVFIGERN